MTNSTLTPADALIAALHEPGREHLLDLVRNPLRLTLLCMTWDGSSLPETQAELYERYLRKIYEWNQNWHELEKYAERCGTTTTKLKQDLNQQLGELAKAALNLPQERFRLSQALVEQHLGEEWDRTSLGYLALRLGWLNRVGKDGRGDSIFAFYHATFQEYFAALAVEDWDYFLPRNHVDCPVAGKRYRIFEKQWKQVILCWLGRGDIEDEKKEGFIRALIEFNDGCGEWNFEKVDRGFYEYHAYFLAAAGVNEFKACSLANEIIRQVVKRSTGDFNSETQEWRDYLMPTLEGLREIIIQGKIRQKWISEIIATSISIIKTTQDETERRNAVRIFGEAPQDNSDLSFAWNTAVQGNLEVIAALVWTLETTENEHTCDDAMYSLGEIAQGNPEVISALIRLLETTQDEKKCESIARNFDKITQETSSVTKDLIRIIKTTNNENIRCSVMYHVLNKIAQGNLEAITALVRILETTNDENTRCHAVYSLGEIAERNPEAIAALVRILETTEDEDTCWIAANSLERIEPGNPAVIPALIRILETTEDKDVLCTVMYRWDEIAQGNPEEIAALIRIFETTEDYNTRWKAAEIVGKIAQGNSEAIAASIRILETTEDEFSDTLPSELPDLPLLCFNTSQDIRWKAAEIVGKIAQGHPEAIAALIQILKTTQDEDTRRNALYSLGKIAQGHPEAIAALIHLLETTQDEHTRLTVAQNLIQIAQGHPEANTALIWLLETTQDEHTRLTVAQNLIQIAQGHPEAIAALIWLLETTQDEYTRRQVARSLGEIAPENPEAIAALIYLLKTTQDENTRCTVARSLGEIAPENPQAIAALIHYLETTYV